MIIADVDEIRRGIYGFQKETGRRPERMILGLDLMITLLSDARPAELVTTSDGYFFQGIPVHYLHTLRAFELLFELPHQTDVQIRIVTEPHPDGHKNHLNIHAEIWAISSYPIINGGKMRFGQWRYMPGSLRSVCRKKEETMVVMELIRELQDLAEKNNKNAEVTFSFKRVGC